MLNASFRHSCTHGSCPASLNLELRSARPPLVRSSNLLLSRQSRVVTYGTYPGASTYGFTNTYPLSNGNSGNNSETDSEGTHNMAIPKGTNGGALPKAEYGKFVHFFRQASPYIEGHRGRTFVIVVPGIVSSDRELMKTVMSDIALLHGLGVQLVVVAGSQTQIDRMLHERGVEPRFVGGYRVTDRSTLKVAIEAAGDVRVACEQFLSKGPAIPMIRRHTKGEREIHFEPAMRVVSGNYITAKRRGVVDGVDFGWTGEVRFVLKDDIKRQMAFGNIVLLSNLGYTAAGEVLNCNTYDVGLHAAVELQADKLFFLHLDEVAGLNLPQWLPLSDAQTMLLAKLQEVVSQEKMDIIKASFDPHDEAELEGLSALPASMRKEALEVMKREGLCMNLDIWNASGFPPAVSTCVVATSRGVKRAHLVDARLDGGLLLECYSRDGVGTMISADFYEGIRKARYSDLDAIQGLLSPLEAAGVLVKRSRDELEVMLPDFTVIERETKVMGCALLLPLGNTADGTSVAEVGAFCVDPQFRGSGRGDSLLDYVEQDARQRGIRRLVLLTTRTADWFEQRDFVWVGPAYSSQLLPEARRSKISPQRNSQLYVKDLEAPSDNTSPGKRIGF